MNRSVVAWGLIGAATGFFVGCGSEYGDCGRGNTECELEKAQAKADATGQDVYVDVDVYNNSYNDIDVDVDTNVDVNVDTDVGVDQTQSGGCATCVPIINPPAAADSGTVTPKKDAGTPAPKPDAGAPKTDAGSPKVDAGTKDAGVVDAGCPNPMVCKNVCSKYKVSCDKKKTCVETKKVCKLQSEW